MYQVFFRMVTRYAPVVTLPFAVVLGFIGYNIERLIPRKEQKLYDSVYAEREQRILDELEGKSDGMSSQSLNILDRNQASSLK